MSGALTITRKNAKEPSLEKLAKSKARGSNGHAKADYKPPTLSEQLALQMRKRARDTATGHVEELAEADYDFLMWIGDPINEPQPADVARFSMIVDRFELAKGKNAPGNGFASPTSKTNGHAGKKSPAPGKELPAAGQIVRLPLASLVRHPVNRHPTKESIAERAESMKRGQLEPILVRPGKGVKVAGLKIHDDEYQVLSGETRWLAAKALGWKEIDARVRECTDAEALELVAEANGQRQDLNPIDRAKLIDKLCAPVAADGAGLSREQAAQRVGLKDGSSASNLVRLLKLPTVWQDRVAGGELDQSWARLLLPVAPLKPMLDALDQLFRGKRVKGCYIDEAFESRRSLEEAIDDLLETVCRLPKNGRYIGGRHQVPKIDLANEQVRKELGIVEVELPSDSRRVGTDAKGKTETVIVATNPQAFDAMIKKLDDSAQKRSAEKGGRDKPAPKRELTAVEQKELRAKQAEQLRDRIAAWRHKFLRRACIANIEAGLDTGLRVVLAHGCAGRNYKGLDFADALEEARSIKPGRSMYREDYWPVVASIEQADTGKTVIADLAKRILAHEVDAGWRCPTVPYSFVDAYAAAIGIKIPQAWANLRANDAGKQLLEEFFLQHQTEQLRALAGELGVHVEAKHNRQAMVKILLGKVSMGGSLPLPKSIKPLATAKRKKGRK